MQNTVIVGFSNNGTSAHYVVDNTTLATELGLPATSVLGSTAITDNVTGGALSDPYIVPAVPELTGPIDGIVDAVYASSLKLYDEAYLFHADGWNQVKNITVKASGENEMLFIADNFVQADMDFSEVSASVTLLVYDGKRGNYWMGEGDDRIVITSATNNADWSNTHIIHTGGGNDVVVVGHGDDALIADTIVNYTDARFTTVSADLGDGNDLYVSGPAIFSTDNVKGGAGSDIISTGGNNDTLEGGLDDGDVFAVSDDLYNLLAAGDILSGGADADKFVYATGDGFDHIVDFEDADVLQLLLGGGDTVATHEATLHTASGDLTGTMVLVNDTAAVFLQDYTNAAEIFV